MSFTSIHTACYATVRSLAHPHICHDDDDDDDDDDDHDHDGDKDS